MKSRFLSFGVLIAGALCCVFTPARGDTIPKGYEVERYAALWQHSPFTLASVQQAPPPSFAADLAVVATATVDDEQIVTFVNKQTHEHFAVGSTPGDDGMKVVSVTVGDDPLNTRVVVQKGSETATVSYDRSLLALQTAALPSVAIANPRQIQVAGATGTAQAWRQSVPIANPVAPSSSNLSQNAPQISGEAPVPGSYQDTQQPASQGSQQVAPAIPSVMAAANALQNQGAVPNAAQLAQQTSLPIQAINDLVQLNALQTNPAGAAAAGVQTGQPQPPATNVQVPGSLDNELPIQGINDLKVLYSMPGNTPPPGFSL